MLKGGHTQIRHTHERIDSYTETHTYNVRHVYKYDGLADLTRYAVCRIHPDQRHPPRQYRPPACCMSSSRSSAKYCWFPTAAAGPTLVKRTAEAPLLATGAAAVQMKAVFLGSGNREGALFQGASSQWQGHWTTPSPQPSPSDDSAPATPQSERSLDGIDRCRLVVGGLRTCRRKG